MVHQKEVAAREKLQRRRSAWWKETKRLVQNVLVDTEDGLEFIDFF